MCRNRKSQPKVECESLPFVHVQWVRATILIEISREHDLPIVSSVPGDASILVPNKRGAVLLKNLDAAGHATINAENALPLIGTIVMVPKRVCIFQTGFIAIPIGTDGVFKW